VKEEAFNVNLRARGFPPVPTVVPIPVIVPAKPATVVMLEIISYETGGNDVRTCGGAV